MQVVAVEDGGRDAGDKQGTSIGENVSGEDDRESSKDW